MGWILCAAVVSAFGFLCMLWVLLGWQLPGENEGLLLCFGTEGFSERGFFRRYLFLRDLGLLECPLIVVDQGLKEPERRKLEQLCRGIEVCTPEEFSELLELEWDRIDGTGNGDHSGRNRRCGISEL